MTQPTAPAEPAASPSTCYRHPSREAGVRCVRCDRPICGECMVPAAVGFQCPSCVSEGRKTVRQPRTMFGGRVTSGADVTKALIALNIGVFVLTLASGAAPVSGGGRSSLYDRFALIPPQVAHGEWWRLFSAMFLHYGIAHIAFNMWALFVVGTPLEQALGRVRFVTLYVLAGVGGNVLSFSIGPLAMSAAGASGAIFGLFGAFFVISRRRGAETGGIVALIAINLALTFAFPNIDWRGHVGGLVTGAAIAVALAYAPAGPRRDRIQAVGCVAVAIVLAAAGFAGAAHVKHRCASATSPFDLGACAAAGEFPGG